MQAYCVRCKVKQTMNNPRDEIAKNGKTKVIKGVCAVCGTGMNILNKTIAQMRAAVQA